MLFDDDSKSIKYTEGFAISCLIAWFPSVIINLMYSVNYRSNAAREGEPPEVLTMTIRHISVCNADTSSNETPALISICNTSLEFGYDR